MDLHRGCNVEVRYIVKCDERLGLGPQGKPYWRPDFKRPDSDRKTYITFLKDSPQDIINHTRYVVDHPIIFVTEI